MSSREWAVLHWPTLDYVQARTVQEACRRYAAGYPTEADGDDLARMRGSLDRVVAVVNEYRPASRHGRDRMPELA